MLSHLEFTPVPDDYYNPISITLDELIAEKVIDFTAEDMQYNYYSITQRDTLNSKIVARFGMREIGITPPGLWKQQFVRIMNEIMPKYKLWYKLIDDDLNFLQNSNSYTKGRNIYSDFPQSQLGGNADYATTGHDYEHETVHDGDVLAKLDALKRYNDVDVEILNELETLFCSFATVNVNGY